MALLKKIQMEKNHI